jgi:SAM-dependent methyltransferase
MSFDTLMSAVRRLTESTESLAVLGAELRLRRDAVSGDPRLRELLTRVATAIEPSLLDGLDAVQESIAHGAIETSFRQAADLLERPARPPGWFYDDPLVLEAQGLASRLNVGAIAAIAEQRPPLAAILKSPGTFLDVGTGVARLAIEVARRWPALRVVGVDPWRPALTIAHQNVAESGLAGRIELRAERAGDLTDNNAYSLAWLPAPFFPITATKDVFARIAEMLAPGGWLIVGFYPHGTTSLANALGELHAVRAGGHRWTAGEIDERLRRAGFVAVEAVSPTSPVHFVLGRKPG